MKNVNHVKFADWVLIHSYMGWRPQELAKIRLDEVNLEQWYIQSGMKTATGKQRIVPIHSRIRNLVQQNYEHAVSFGSEYLFNDPEVTKGGMKLIVGHKIEDITEVVYTDRDLEWLREDLEKIK